MRRSLCRLFRRRPSASLARPELGQRAYTPLAALATDRAGPQSRQLPRLLTVAAALASAQLGCSAWDSEPWALFRWVSLASLALADSGKPQQDMSEEELEEEIAHERMIYEVEVERHNRRFREMKLFSGTANIPLAEEIASKLETTLGKVQIKEFADGEIGIQVLENVRGKDVYLIQPTCPPGVNDHIMELILLISTMRRASARSITAILPYYGYARQDRKMQSRVPISAADVARLLEAMGVDRVVAVDLHCGQIQGFFGPRTPCDNLDGSVVALPFFKSIGLDPTNTVVVSPDAGGVYRAKRFRDGLQAVGIDAGLAMIVKQRARANEIAQMDLVGEVDGCDCIIVDDMIDTAGTLCKAGAELKKRGARRIFAFATHGLFNGPAISRIQDSDFENVVVCNTVPLEAKKRNDKIHVLSIGALLAKTIYSIHFKRSISELFELESQGKQQQPAASSMDVPSWACDANAPFEVADKAKKRKNKMKKNGKLADVDTSASEVMDKLLEPSD